MSVNVCIFEVCMSTEMHGEGFIRVFGSFISYLNYNGYAIPN